MIEKIQGLSIQGRCFSQPADLDLFPQTKDRIRVSVVFGRNGSGKSTISKSIYEIATGENSGELSASFYDDRHNPLIPAPDSLFVFNEDYIRRNLRVDEDGLHTIIFLGDQVDIKEEMDKYLEQKGKMKEELKQVEETIVQNRSDIHRNAIINTLKRGGWAARDRDIKGHKDNSAVNDKVFERICKQTVVSAGDTLEALQAEFDEQWRLLKQLSSDSGSYFNPIQQIQWNDGLEGEIVNGILKAVEKPVWTEREQLIFAVVEKHTLPFVEKARGVFTREKTTVCPFCLQEVTEEYKHGLLEDISRVLNQDAEAHQEELKQWNQTLQGLSQRLNLESVRSCSKLNPELWQEIENLASQCMKRIIPQYMTAISEKLNNVYQSVDISMIGLEDLLSRLNTALKKLEAQRIAFNENAKKVSRLKEELIRINNKIAHIQTSTEYALYLEQQQIKRELEEKRDNFSKELQQIDKELGRLNRKRSSAGNAALLINKELDYIFFSEDRLRVELATDYSGATERYILKSNQANVKPGSLSAGERNIIALCYFFADILSNQEEADFYRKETLIVIDDPVSSFDFENRVGIMTLLRSQISKFVKGSQNSRVLIFSHDLVTVYDLMKALKEIMVLSAKNKQKPREVSCPFYVCELKRKEISDFFTKKDGNPQARHEYGDLLNMIFAYADGKESDNSLVIGNVMRRALEVFSTFMYKKGIENVSTDPEITKLLGSHAAYFENMMYRLVLHGESHFEEQVKSLHADINFFGFISEEEKKSTAKNILLFMYLLNPLHIKIYLGDNCVAILEHWKEKLEEKSEKHTSGQDNV